MNCKINPDFTVHKDFIANLPERFNGDGETLYVGRNVVKAFSTDGVTLVVKRFKRPNIVQAVAYTFFKKSKAERAFLFARMIRERGFNTPHEVAFIEIKHNGLLQDSFFVSTSCTLPPLSELLRRPDFSRNVAAQLGRYVAKLHEKGVLHGDLNLTNILYDMASDGLCTFWLIDTNRSVFKQPTKNDCLENLKRLTHDRPLLECIVRNYAAARGWQEGETVAGVMKCLDGFEKKHERKRRLQRFFVSLSNGNKC